MARTLTIVRGFPGSGKTTLATEIAAFNGTLISVDSVLNELRGGEDIYASRAIAKANAAVKDSLMESVASGDENIVVDMMGERLFQIRDLWALARNDGYQLVIREPATAWARDPRVCNDRTQFPLRNGTWENLIITWEAPATLARIEHSMSPMERLTAAKWIMTLADNAAPNDRAIMERFFLDNFRQEMPHLMGNRFIGKGGKTVRDAFRVEMETEGIAPPSLEEINTPHEALDRLMKSLESIDKKGPSLN
jgi:hypothetical protein